MKYSLNPISKAKKWKIILSTGVLILLSLSLVQAQDEKSDESDKRPVKAPFESAQLMDLQSVVVPTAKTLEFNIQHRFGTVENGISELYGIYAPANIRMVFSYTPIENLALGFGFTKFKKQVDLNLKYAIVKQRRDWSIPVSVTYSGNIVIDTRAPENFAEDAHRLSFYHELNVASRLNSKISLQLTPSFSHFNAVDSLYKNDMIAVAIAGRYKFSAQSSIMISYVQQLTDHNDPNFKLKPGVTIGWEIATSGHGFQIFFTNFQGIIPQENIAYNSFDFFKGEFLIGFNITRLWNF
ncbi:MAG: DUF5777 family beta-barrel protein [Cyclobacteriaceae bacterium]